MKSKVFIGSSVESLDIAYAIQEILSYDAEITVWTQGIFDLSSNALNDLLKALDAFDFGIFVFSAEDIIKIRDQQFSTTRDNVLFEFGLFLGKLGKDRSFFILPKNQPDFHLPTDLIGLTPAIFDLDRSDNNLIAALGPTCNPIRRAIQKLGAVGNKYGLTLYSRVKDEAHFTKLLDDAKHELIAIGPTLLYVAQYLKEYVFKKAEEGVSVRFLMMDDQEESVRLIENITSPFNLPNELRLCHITLKKWLEEIQEKQFDIQIKVTPIVPYSLTIVDGKHEKGRILIIPTPYRTSGVDRPCILIEKRVYPEAFSVYYDRAVDWLNNSMNLQ